MKDNDTFPKYAVPRRPEAVDCQCMQVTVVSQNLAYFFDCESEMETCVRRSIAIISCLASGQTEKTEN